MSKRFIVGKIVDLLPAAKANGHKRDVRGLKVCRATITPEKRPRRRAIGLSIEVETHGRDISYRERTRLLEFACATIDAEG